MKLNHAATIMMIIVATSGTTGCATVMVSDSREKVGHLTLEIGTGWNFLDGSYLGNTERDGHRFARILIVEPQAACENRPPIEMLLPLSSEKAARPLLRDMSGTIPEKGMPARIMTPGLDQSIAEEWLKAESWPG